MRKVILISGVLLLSGCASVIKGCVKGIEELPSLFRHSPSPTPVSHSVPAPDYQYRLQQSDEIIYISPNEISAIPESQCRKVMWRERTKQEIRKMQQQGYIQKSAVDKLVGLFEYKHPLWGRVSVGINIINQDANVKVETPCGDITITKQSHQGVTLSA